MIADRLVDKGSEFVSFDEESRFTDKGSEFVEYAAVHAPKGGVTIKGQFYPGGEFIPGHVLEGMDEVERAKAGVPKPVGSLAKEMKDKDKTDQQAQVGDPSNIADVMEWDIDPDRPWQEQLDKMRVPMVPFDIPQLGKISTFLHLHFYHNTWSHQATTGCELTSYIRAFCCRRGSFPREGFIFYYLFGKLTKLLFCLKTKTTPYSALKLRCFFDKLF